ncbi:MAG: DUF3048 domain-containing protein [Anaerolineae bacterium]|nr:DUF3048 domain-containing protein [Anaerolineae bacterium]
MKHFRLFIALSLVVGLLSAALGASVAAQAPTATATPPYKPTPTRSATALPTAVVPAPLPTIVLAPSVPTATLAATAASPVAPVGEAAPAPEGANPLTGLPVSDPAVLQHRPILVKVSNYPAAVRPQHAIGRADHVWEHVIEGGATRLTAVYLTEDMLQIGSTRSARPIDTYLVPMYQGLLAYSGASIGTQQMLEAQPWADRIFWQKDDCPIFCRYDVGSDVDIWHTLFVNAAALREEAVARGIDGPVDLRGLTFSEEPPPGGAPAANLNLQYPATNSFWYYSPITDNYYRWQEGEPHHDAVGDRQLVFENVVLIYANHTESDIVEDEVGAGHHAMDIQIKGEGPAKIFRGGFVCEARWVAPEGGGMLRLADAAGNDIPLKPGRTWFYALPLDHTDLQIGQ